MASFRELVKEIPSTIYATHGLYMYPAKFIPHVVRFALKEYTSEGDWVFDPFAGYGTVGIEASLTGRNFILWDLNPVMKHVLGAALYTGSVDLRDILVDFDYKERYVPRWSNIDYWYPREFLEILSRAWGYYHYQVPEKLKPVVAIPLLKITRYFSYSDEKIPKLCKSEYSVKKVREILHGGNPLKHVEKKYEYHAKRVVKKIKEFQSYNPKAVASIVKAGVDSLSLKLDRSVELLVTSPPYLQSQEYIRSFKLELMWLGYSENYVRALSKLEIPYRNQPDVEVNSSTYKEFREKVASFNSLQLLRIYDTYFQSLAKFFNNNHERVNTIAVFVSRATIRGVKVPIDEILKEHLESLGWKHKVTYIDKIKNHRIGKVIRNLQSEEHLLVMTRE